MINIVIDCEAETRESGAWETPSHLSLTELEKKRGEVVGLHLHLHGS